MSSSTASTAGVLFVLLPAVAYGGASLLKFLGRRTPGYLDNPVRRGLVTAGHAHARVLVLLSLVALPYLEMARLYTAMGGVARTCIPAAPILMPAGFFLSVASPAATRPNRLIYLTYLGGLSLTIGALVLGIGLLTRA